MLQKVDTENLADWLLSHPNWRLEREKLIARFQFEDFRAAWSFMCRVAQLAERCNHHPDWSNSYSRVDIALTTHDAGGLTTKDLQLAEAIDEAVQ